MTKTAATILLLMLTITAAWADGPQMKPGKWEFTSTISIPMMPEPQTITNVDCITEEESKKDPLAAVVEQGHCQVVNRQVAGSRIDFEVACQADKGITSTGKGYFTITGDTATGKMEVIMNMPEMPDLPNMKGQEMKMEQSWEGRRIGDCDGTE